MVAIHQAWQIFHKCKTGREFAVSFVITDDKLNSFLEFNLTASAFKSWASTFVSVKVLGIMENVTETQCDLTKRTIYEHILSSCCDLCLCLVWGCSSNSVVMCLLLKY